MLIEQLTQLSFLRVSKYVNRPGIANASQSSVTCETPGKSCKIAIVATEPVTAEFLRPVVEGVDHLQIVQTHYETAFDMFGNVQRKYKSDPLSTSRRKRSVRRGESHRGMGIS
jgi:hypothetical protein